MSNLNVAMLHARRIELHEHPAPPAGAEVHRGGIRHEVQRGETARSIARDYSQAFHLDVSAQELRSANTPVFEDRMYPGDTLVIPGLDARIDSAFLADNPRLKRVGRTLVHTVDARDTLSNIARRYNAANGTRVTWQQIHAANRDTIGPNPDRIKPGQQLRIPGISNAAPRATLQGVRELDGDVVLTRTARVRDESGRVRTIDVMRYTADASEAERFGSVEEAIWMARNQLHDHVARSNPLAIVQTRDGAYQLLPITGHEHSAELDDSTRTLSLAYRSEQRGLVAVVEQGWDSDRVDVRRFDR